MSKYFTLEELLYSKRALDKKISNLPSFQIVKNLELLADTILDPLREDWGSAINVSSGFRGEKLNKEVGGVDNSIHKTGFAVDIQPANGKMKEFKAFVRDWFKDKDFDQVIIEKNKNGDEWIHIGLFNNEGLQRKQLFSLSA